MRRPFQGFSSSRIHSQGLRAGSAAPPLRGWVELSFFTGDWKLLFQSAYNNSVKGRSLALRRTERCMNM